MTPGVTGRQSFIGQVRCESPDDLLPLDIPVRTLLELAAARIAVRCTDVCSGTCYVTRAKDVYLLPD